MKNELEWKLTEGWATSWENCGSCPGMKKRGHTEKILKRWNE